MSDINTDVEVIPTCICNICKEEVLDNETKALGCDLCKSWYHPKCVGKEAILELLDAVAQIDEGNDFLGCLLWICPICSSDRKDIKYENGACELLTEQMPPKSKSKDKSVICKSYRLGTCNEGDSCKFSHPP